MDEEVDLQRGRVVADTGRDVSHQGAVCAAGIPAETVDAQAGIPGVRAELEGWAS